jgi:hypothetical protein
MDPQYKERHTAPALCICSEKTKQPSNRPEEVQTSVDIVIDGCPQEIMLEITKTKVALITLNAEIKTTLTILLNCEGVKSDEKYRAGIHRRISDVEKDLAHSKSLDYEPGHVGRAN